MRCLSSLPSSVPRDFRDRVRHECDVAALGGETITYREIAEAVIGDADRGTRDRRFIRLVDMAMCENMKDDHKAKRPFSAVAVRQTDTDIPGSYFFNQAWELGRFGGDDDPAKFAEQEWASYCQSLRVVLTDDHADDLAPAIAA